MRVVFWDDVPPTLVAVHWYMPASAVPTLEIWRSSFACVGSSVSFTNSVPSILDHSNVTLTLLIAVQAIVSVSPIVMFLSSMKSITGG